MTDVDVNVNVDVDAGVCVDVDHVWGEVSAFNACCVFWNVSLIFVMKSKFHK